MMRHCLGGDMDTRSPRLSDEVDSSAGANMERIEPTTGFGGQIEISGQKALLGQCRKSFQSQAGGNASHVHAAAHKGFIFAMDHHWTVQMLAGFESRRHDFQIVAAITVIGEPDCPGGGDLSIVDRTTPQPPHRDRCDRQDPHDRLDCDFLVEQRDRFGRVERWLRIGHTADGGESARGRGRCAGGNGFLLIETGLAEMHVHVDQPRGDDQPGGVDIGFGAACRDLANSSDSAVFEQKIGDAVELGASVYDAAVANRDGSRMIRH